MPELVNLPRSAGVTTAPMTHTLLPELSRGGGNVHNHITVHVDFHGVGEARGARELNAAGSPDDDQDRTNGDDDPL